MSVVSKALDNIGNEIIKGLFNGKTIEGDIKFGKYEGKLVITFDFVNSRDEKSESGFDLWVSFSFGVLRINFNVA